MTSQNQILLAAALLFAVALILGIVENCAPFFEKKIEGLFSKTPKPSTKDEQ